MAEQNIMGMTLNVQKEFIEGIAKQVVTENIMSALGGGSAFVETIIKEILSTKVDPGSGRVSTYRDGVPYIQYLMNEIIKEEFKGVVKEAIEEHRPEIRARLKAALMKKENTDKFMNGFIDTVLRSMENPFRTNIDISFTKNEGY